MQKNQSYSFNVPDREDDLVAAFGGLIWKDEKRVRHVTGPWYLLAYLFVLFGSLSVGFRLLSDPSQPLIALGAVLLAWIGYSAYACTHPHEHWPRFFESLPAAANVFIVSKAESLASLASFPLVLAFVLLERIFDRRYLPLWIVTRVAVICALTSLVLAIYFHANVFSLCPYLHPIIRSLLVDLLREHAKDTVSNRLLLSGHYLCAWLWWTYAQAMVFAVIPCLVCWLFSRRIDMNVRPLPEGVRHLSDLHVTSGTDEPIQPNALPNEQVFRKLAEQAQIAHVLVISGDVTDGGLRQEWRTFLEKCKPLKTNATFIMCPGNHDLHAYSRKYRPFFSSIPMPSCLPRLRKIRYLSAVNELCPGAYVMEPNGPRALHDYIAQNEPVFSEYAYGVGSELARKIDSIWDAAFPMFWTVGDKTFVALDTNRTPSNFLTSALGDVDSAQLHRLKRIADSLPSSTSLIVAGHHHVYTPPSRKPWVEFKMKYLQLLRSNALTRTLSKIDCHYLHGHRHYTFKFSIGKMSVASAPSGRYDDTR